MMNILSNGSDSGLEEVLSGCFGCCCCDFEKDVDELLQQYSCGHRVNYRNEQTAKLARTLLDAAVPKDVHINLQQHMMRVTSL